MQESLKNLAVLEKGTIEDTACAPDLGQRPCGHGRDRGSSAPSPRTNRRSHRRSHPLAQKKIVLRVDNRLRPHLPSGDAREKDARPRQAVFHKDNPLKPGLDKEELKGMLRMRISPKVLNLAVDGLVKKKQIEAEGSKLRIPGFKAAGGKVNDEVKNKIVEAIKKGGTQPPVREELPALFSITRQGRQGPAEAPCRRRQDRQDQRLASSGQGHRRDDQGRSQEVS